MRARTLAQRAWIVLAALAVAAAGCGPGNLDKAGGVIPKQVVLTLANDSSDLSGAQPFASAVRQLSHGALLIKIVGPSARLQDLNMTSEAPVVRAVQADRAQLGATGTQAFDTLGVTSFQALQAPFLINSYALQRKVMGSEIAKQMLAALKPIGLVGVGLLPGGFARPFGIARPLVAASDFRGVKIGTLSALVDEETFRALGAIPDPNGVIPGYAGVETDVQAADTGMNVPGATLTGNVILWPWPGVIFMNRRAFESLTAAQRSDLLRAGMRARAATPSWGNDAVFVRDLCRRNKIVNASSADMAGLLVAVRQVYRSLESNPLTKSFITQITTLRQAMDVPPDAVTCTSIQNAPAGSTTVRQLEGTWQVTYTEQQFVAAGADHTEIYVLGGNWGHFSLRLSSGHWWLRLIGGDPGAAPAYRASSGTYAVTGNKILFRRLDRAYLGSDTEVWGPYIWSVYRDTLTFRKAGSAPMRTDLVVKPWLKTT